MIDYFFRWNNEDEAKHDAVRLRNYFGHTTNDSPDVIQSWFTNWFLPNVKAWRISQDVQVPDGRGGMMVQHTYLAGWFGLLALDQLEPVILNDNNLQFALFREFDPLASPKNLVVKNNIGAIINDVGVAPIFAGSKYPLGGF